MKVTTTAVKVNPDHYLNVNCNVHKDRVYFFARVLKDTQCTDRCRNRTRAAERTLRQFAAIARKHGKEMIRALCGPTGEYDRLLLRTAHRLPLRSNELFSATRLRNNQKFAILQKYVLHIPPERVK